MTIGQFLSLALAVVWFVALVFWAVDKAMAVAQRRVVRSRLRQIVDHDRAQELHAIMKGTDRLRAGYQSGHWGER